MRVPGRLCPPGLPRKGEELHDAELGGCNLQESPFFRVVSLVLTLHAEEVGSCVNSQALLVCS